MTIPPKLVAGLLAVSVTALPITFGVAFPYSLAIFEVSIFALFLMSLLTFRFRRSDLVAAAILIAGFLAHVLVLSDGHSVLRELVRRELFDEPVRVSVDVQAALDSFRRAFSYFAVLLLAARLAEDTPSRMILYRSLSVCALVLIMLALLAPHDSKNVLWIHATPTFEFNWLSPTVNPLLSSMFGYRLEYSIDDIPILVDNWQVSLYPVGSILNQNQFAAAFGVTAPLLLGTIADWLRSNRVDHRTHVAVFLSISVFSLQVSLSNYSVGGALGMSMAILGFFVAVHRSTSLRAYTVTLSFCAIGTFMLISLFPSLPLAKLDPARSMVWAETISTFLSQPAFGIGLGNYPDLRVGVPGAPNTMWAFATWCAAHNVYLQFLAEAGTAGLAVISVAWVLLRRRTATNERQQMSFSQAGLYASMVYCGIHAAVDYSPAMPFCAALSAVVAGLIVENEAGSSVRPNKRVGWQDYLLKGFIFTTLLALSLSSLAYVDLEVSKSSLKNLTMQQLVNSGDQLESAKELRKKVEAIERDRTTMPSSKDMLLSLANAHVVLTSHFGAEHLTKAAQLLKQYQSIGRYDLALRATEQAIASQKPIAESPPQ